MPLFAPLLPIALPLAVVAFLRRRVLLVLAAVARDDVVDLGEEKLVEVILYAKGQLDELALSFVSALKVTWLSALYATLVAPYRA